MEKDRVHIVADLVLESWQRKSQVSIKKKKKKKKNRFAPHRRTPSFNVQSTESTFGQYTIL